MSNLERVENLKQIIKLLEPDFNQLATIHNAVHYKREASFALQALNNNSYLMQMAFADQDAFKRAIINVAAVGLSLNPVQRLAYLVPRDGKVQLDIGYLGYVQLAMDAGALAWAVAEIVYEKDTYEFQGAGKEPIHKFNPYDKDRGKIVGAYCLAKTNAGEFVLTQMSTEEIYKIRDRSSSWRAHAKDKSKTSPWATDETEMMKKTVIRRGSKSWPMTDSRSRVRLDQALEVGNEADPIELAAVTPPANESKFQTNIAEIRKLLARLPRSEEQYLEHIIRVYQRDLKKLEDMTELEAEQAIVSLKSMITRIDKNGKKEKGKSA